MEVSAVEIYGDERLGETNLISRLTGATDRDLSKIEKIIIFCPISVSPRISFLCKLRNVLNKRKSMIVA